MVMDTPIRWKVKRRLKEMRLSVLIAFLMFVTSGASAGKRPSDVIRLLLCIVWSAHQTRAAHSGECARMLRAVCPVSQDWGDRRRGWGAWSEILNYCLRKSPSIGAVVCTLKSGFLSALSFCKDPSCNVHFTSSLF